MVHDDVADDDVADDDVTLGGATYDDVTHDDATQYDAPYFRGLPSNRWEVGPEISRDQVASILSEAAYSFPVRHVTGVVRYDGAQVASNIPCEDQFIHDKFPSPWNDGNYWMTWGIFDGHMGCQTVVFLREILLPFVRHSLCQLRPRSGEEIVPEELVQDAIMQGFVKLDDSIIKEAYYMCQREETLPVKVKKLAPAFSGSCALLSTCYNGSEVARILNEHPGEEYIVGNGRVLGLGVSRAFGDCQWKWPIDFQKEVQQRFYGPVPTRAVQTPPYLTAEPIVTSTKIDPESPSFLIMATDGLWGLVSSEQAVNLVGRWLESGAPGKGTDPEPTYEPFDFGPFWKDMDWKFVEERETVQDDNAAVHLLRNALGGNHHEMIAGRLAFDHPSSRRVLDDMAVQVVFFNNDGIESKIISSDT
ncbi:PP2C family serine/threonine-protein phosphatase [Aspergillus ibericus CBS 121593]|uniref:Protein serine/threonine phosphatase 2C n=1 Tax=Aspergillus ibericus CBS 121593 TaxID=1448316 RepID=A0A395GRT7_9EURO|nr:protein serine/threonine phosphatase 2C [Aspergillus ibericus CBS 121593]RAK96793.1 protein serine/threonine phosphatase 2C [Aspergillus ibericus CBS 121593]